MSKNNLERTLSNSLLTLLDNHNFKEITTEMVCDHAGISRSTFYRHFKDKHELLLWEVTNHYKMISKFVPEFTSINNIYIFSFAFMKSKKDYYRKLIKVNGQNSFKDFLFKQIISYLENRILAISNSKTIDSKTQYSLEMFAQSHIYAVEKWIKNGFYESPIEMTNILCMNMPECLKRHIIKYSIVEVSV